MEPLLEFFGWIPFIREGGITMIPIFLCAVLAPAIAAERLIALRRSAVFSRDFLVDLEALAAKRGVESAITLCRKNGGALAAILLQGLKYLDLPRPDLMAILESHGRAQALRLSRFMGLLSLIATISPLLGLLGTVLGMIKVFTVVQAGGMGNPQMLSGGISEALISTAAGLTIAIPTVVAHRYLNDRANRFILEMEALTVEFISLFRGEPQHAV